MHGHGTLAVVCSIYTHTLSSPPPRSRHAAVVMGNEIYVIGGVNQKLDDPPRPLPASVLKYSIATNTWTALTNGEDGQLQLLV